MATYWENSCSFGLRYVSWYEYLIVSLFFSHLGFWSGNLFLIAPFPDLCLLVPFFDAFLNSFNLPINGLGGLLWNCFWQIGLLTPCSEVPWEYTHSIQSRFLHHLWGNCAFLINKTMHIYANTLNMNNFTQFKMYLKIIKCYKSFIM